MAIFGLVLKPCGIHRITSHTTFPFRACRGKKPLTLRFLSAKPIPKRQYQPTETANLDQEKARDQKSHKSSITITTILCLLPLYLAIDHAVYGHPTTFDPPRFTPFFVADRQVVSSTSIILTLRPFILGTKDCGSVISESLMPSSYNPSIWSRLTKSALGHQTHDPYGAWWEKGTWSVEVKQPELQIAREYTPLPPRDGDNEEDLRFLVRREAGGEVSGYLHRQNYKDRVGLRGPKIELELAEPVTDVVFLAGGTGIAPAMQLAYVLLDRAKEGGKKPHIHIAWANRRREDCVGAELALDNVTATGQIVAELRALQQRHPSNLRIDYFVDEEGTFITQKRIAQFTDPSASMSTTGRKLLVVSGPEGFVSHFAGPKKWEGRGGQGQVAGVIGQLGLSDWKIWKM